MRILPIVLTVFTFSNTSLLVYLFATKALNQCLKIRFGMFIAEHIFKYMVFCYSEVSKERSYSKMIFLWTMASMCGILTFTAT